MTLLTRSSEKRPLTRHIDELNLARLGLISMQSRVGAGSTSWEDQYGEGNERMSVKCIGTPQYLVPYGVDNDVIIGILCLFAAQGFPDSNAVSGTANQFLRASGLDTSGRYHKNLHESLMRLSHTNFHIERGWHDGKRYRTVIFRHLHEIIFDTAQPGGVVDQDSVITVVLPPIIAESLRRGFIKPLSSGVLGELSQPTARALYRLLDGHRHDLTDPGQRLSEFTVGLVEWGRKARILNLSPDKIRRVLDPAHEELLRAHYLASVIYQGRGQNQSIQYVFEREIVALDPLLLSRLTGRGIAPKVARNLMESLGVETARERLDEVERLIAGKKTPGPGFFVNFMRSPDDYRPRQTHGQLKAPVSGKAPLQPRLLGSEPDPDQVARQRFEQLSPMERAQETVRSLKVVYGSRLGNAEYKKLGEVLEVEAMDAAALRAEAARALATGTCDAQAALLQTRLGTFTAE
ncbi:replication initiator protein A [Deinococcus rubellus]|uniref:replication initiator protein A n=1 Tax=Deinococcus rubellus TaxID=1889240 RepID=UPI0031EE6399